MAVMMPLSAMPASSSFFIRMVVPRFLRDSDEEVTDVLQFRRMRRPLAPLVIAVGLVLAAACAAVFLRIPRVKRSEPARPTVIGTLPSPEALLEALPDVAADVATSTPPVETREERVLAPPIGYLQPPTRNLTGGTLGRQRVPLPEGIGDIHKLYYHVPTLTLFMVVTEKGGARSIWKLPENGVAERVLFVNLDAGEIRIDGDSKGVIYFQHDNPPRLYRSGDGMKTWHLVSKDVSMFWSIADDGGRNVYATTHDWNRAVLYRSPDDGFSWEPWIDFQRLFPQYARTYRRGRPLHAPTPARRVLRSAQGTARGRHGGRRALRLHVP